MPMPKMPSTQELIQIINAGSDQERRTMTVMDIAISYAGALATEELVGYIQEQMPAIIEEINKTRKRPVIPIGPGHWEPYLRSDGSFRSNAEMPPQTLEEARRSLMPEKDDDAER